MFTMLGFPDWSNVDMEDAAEVVEKLKYTGGVQTGDIVEVGTRFGRPVLGTYEGYDDVAHLRVLGECQSHRMLYALLVTDADSAHVTASGRVDRQVSLSYEVEQRFFGEEMVIVTDLHLRRLVKAQRGRWCEKCNEYNEDMRIPYSQVYFCFTCAENPWR